jgi:DNA recombination protein Rad52
MSAFSNNQLKALNRKLDRRHVQTRQVEGKQIDYIEGWFAIAEANNIFGFSGWDREVVHFERAYERTRGEQTSCGYLARVRISVRAGRTRVFREGTGWGSASARMPADAHERALKAAETDATKRALATFGNRFGLALYDKGQTGVTSLPRFTLRDPTGAPLAEDLSPEAFCSGLRQSLDLINTPAELSAVQAANASELERLRQSYPRLQTQNGEHYADVLERLFQGNAQRLSGGEPKGSVPSEATIHLLQPSRIANGPRIDKSALAHGCERRLRDESHLRAVRALPCLVCGRTPSHAHHLKFAQAAGVALKVSDEFVVPLCSVHHDGLHRAGSEQDWWSRQGLSPLPLAHKLWRRTHPGASEVGNDAPQVEDGATSASDAARGGIDGAMSSTDA